MITQIYQQALPVLEIDDQFYLREQAVEDLDAFYEYYTDPQVGRHILAHIPRNKAQAKEEILYCRNLFYYRQGLSWALARKHDDRMIGAICLYAANTHHRMEISYDLHRKYWRKGIMSRAVEKVLAYLFQQGETYRVEALIVSQNTASIEMLKKLGFAHEGCLHNYRYHKQKPVDVEVFAMTPVWFQKIVAEKRRNEQ
jgi:ribosomal-protein-alanine N-acetyltransferase